MASAFGHGAAALTISNIFKLKTKLSFGMVLLAVVCSILPDADVIAFKFGIPYESMWGHRGITHSFFFAAILSSLLAYFFSKTKREFWALNAFLFLATSSHTLLDACTTGGLGVALFAPFDNSRYFLPWQVIKVSPLSLSSFFSSWGIKVLMSEFIWIGIPFLLSTLVLKLFKKTIR